MKKEWSLPVIAEIADVSQAAELSGGSGDV
jgi:hypothetical protein